jgi:hypothetical protein
MTALRLKKKLAGFPGTVRPPPALPFAWQYNERRLRRRCCADWRREQFRTLRCREEAKREMARSYRHQPFMGIAGGPRASEKDYKARVRRRLRHAVRTQLTRGEEALYERSRDVESVWNGPKDGKFRFDPSRSVSAPFLRK